MSIDDCLEFSATGKSPNKGHWKGVHLQSLKGQSLFGGSFTLTGLFGGTLYTSLLCKASVFFRHTTIGSLPVHTKIYASIIIVIRITLCV